MTEKEENAIEYMKSILEYKHLYASTGKDTDFLRGIDKEKIETVVQALEQKDKIIEYWKNGFERELESNRENVIEIIKKDKEIAELKEKYDKDTHTLQNQLDVANADRVEKDKIIKAMAKYLNSTDIDEDICKTVSKEFNCTLYQNEDFCINCIIAYFQKKAREENE